MKGETVLCSCVIMVYVAADNIFKIGNLPPDME